jgi:hypothetical protein
LHRTFLKNNFKINPQTWILKTPYQSRLRAKILEVAVEKFKEIPMAKTFCIFQL